MTSLSAGLSSLWIIRYSYTPVQMNHNTVRSFCVCVCVCVRAHARVYTYMMTHSGIYSIVKVLGAVVAFKI